MYSVYHFLSLTLGMWSIHLSATKTPQPKMDNGAPTWKASTLNLQCFDHTTAAQLFHHQLAFHVASGWLDPGNKRLKLPPPKMYLLSKMGGNMPLALGITFRNWEFPTPPPKRVGKSQHSAGIRTSLSTKPNQQTKYHPQTNSSHQKK